MSRVLLFTYSQADWGLFQPIVEGLMLDNDLELTLVTFSEERWAALEEDGEGDHRLMLPDIIQVPMTALFATTAAALYDLIFPLRGDYDAVIILGDRIQELSAAIASTTLGLDIHHLFGGDTSGCLDDQFRDAISCMATHVYCFSQEASFRGHALRKATGDNFRCHYVHMPKEEFDPSALESLAQFGVKAGKYILARIHPETTCDEPVGAWITDICARAQEHDWPIVYFPPNVDDGYEDIEMEWSSLESNDAVKVIRQEPVKRAAYLHLLQNAAHVVGNSSSFVHDTIPAQLASHKVELLGNRQHDRVAMDYHADEDIVTVLLRNIHEQPA